MRDDKIIRRLLQYRTCLERFRRMGFEQVYSYNLGKEAGVSAEQVRKDFSRFNIQGNKKAGYQIDDLLGMLNMTFGKHEVQKVFIVGMGHIGKALLNYKGFASKKIEIVAGFDIDPSKLKKREGIQLYYLDDLPAMAREMRVTTAIIAVPDIQAQRVCDLLVNSGIKGIMNFAPIVLKVPEDIYVTNINLSNELESILYHVNEKQAV